MGQIGKEKVKKKVDWVAPLIAFKVGHFYFFGQSKSLD